MKKLFSIIIATILYACSSDSGSGPIEDHYKQSSIQEQPQLDSLSLQFSSIMKTNLDSITYSSQIIYPTVETSDSLILKVVLRNNSLKEKRLFIDKGSQMEYRGKHPLFHSLEIYNENDSDMVSITWAAYSSDAKVLTKEYLEQLEASKVSILPGDSIISQFYISRLVRYKESQQLRNGNYRLILGDENKYSDTLSFEIID